MLFVDAALASLLAWGVAMTSRQAGHFFFEPKHYDHENGVSHEYKEEVKVGYNLTRKYVLMGLWLAIPLVLAAEPTLFGLLERPATALDFLRHVGFGWLCFGVAAILFRVTQLWIERDLETGIVWATKIVTDPFNEIGQQVFASGVIGLFGASLVIAVMLLFQRVGERALTWSLRAGIGLAVIGMGVAFFIAGSNRHAFAAATIMRS